MDPAFSLADELHDLRGAQGLDQQEEYGLDSELHRSEAMLGGFGDESGLGRGLDGELRGLHLHHGHDLASELGAGSLADELGGGIVGGGSLADELDPDYASSHLGEDMSRHVSQQSSSTLDSRSPSRASHNDAETHTPFLHIPPGDISQTLTASHSFISQLGSLSSKQDGDTEKLEVVAASFLKLVSESSAHREGQLRELRELDRILSRSCYPPLHSALPNTSWSPHPSSPRSTHSLDETANHTRSTSLSSNSTITSPLAPPTNLPVLHSSLFTPLYNSTSQLVTSLTLIHEQTQVTKSTSADAARKLKTVKGLVEKCKIEFESVRESEEWIARYEDEERGTRAGQRWVKEQLDWCKGRIEEVQGRARFLLTPVPLSI